jgi:hypothetical protein
MKMSNYDRRYSLRDGGTLEERQQRWQEENPNEPFPANRSQDAPGALAWRLDRMEATIARILDNYEGLGSEVAEKLGKQLKSQFTIQSDVHYDDHMYIKDKRAKEKEIASQFNSIKIDIAKWIIICLLGLIFLSINYKQLFHIT